MLKVSGIAIGLAKLIDISSSPDKSWEEYQKVNHENPLGVDEEFFELNAHVIFLFRDKSFEVLDQGIY